METKLNDSKVFVDAKREYSSLQSLCFKTEKIR